jgi:hypothetical protein
MSYTPEVRNENTLSQATSPATKATGNPLDMKEGSVNEIETSYTSEEAGESTLSLARNPAAKTCM